MNNCVCTSCQRCLVFCHCNTGIVGSMLSSTILWAAEKGSTNNEKRTGESGGWVEEIGERHKENMKKKGDIR